MIVCGIYSIFCKTNKKEYIGSSCNITNRFSKHRWELRHNKHYNLHLQRSWNKYGESSFEFNVVEECLSQDLFIREQRHLDEKGNKFNICPDAQRMRHSEETKRKISVATKGKNNPMYGRKMTTVAKQKLREINLGKKHTPEQIEKQIKAQTGRIFTKQTRKKLRLVHLGRKCSKETIEKMREQGKKRKHFSKTFENTTSKFKGVTWKKDRNKWKAYIKKDQRQIHLGYFNSETEAAKAYNVEALRLFGDRSVVNPI